MRNRNRRTIFAASIILATLLAIPCIVPQPSGSASAAEYKMSTKVPPGIAMPDTVETRLGTLRFFDGFPDNASVGKLYDNLDFQRAVQAYLLGLAPGASWRIARGSSRWDRPTRPCQSSSK